MAVPVRSISLPSRLLPNSVEAELRNLGGLSNVHADGETICRGFTRLAELYNKMEEMIQSPLTHQAFQHQQNTKLVEEALDDSLGLLDACGNARDLISMMKEQVQELQSALRRRRGGGDSSIETNILGLAYINFRKKLTKEIAKSLRMLKKLEGNGKNIKIGSLPLFDIDSHVVMAVKAVRESNAMAISVFRSFLWFLSMPVMKSNGWSSLMSKLKAESQRSQNKVLNEVGIVDLKLSKGNSKNIDELVKRLETLCFSIEEGLESLFRCLLRHRVSLLNLITFTPC